VSPKDKKFEKNKDPRRSKDYSKALVQIKIDDEIIAKLAGQSIRNVSLKNRRSIISN